MIRFESPPKYNIMVFEHGCGRRGLGLYTFNIRTHNKKRMLHTADSTVWNKWFLKHYSDHLREMKDFAMKWMCSCSHGRFNIAFAGFTPKELRCVTILIFLTLVRGLIPAYLGTKSVS